MHLRLFEPPDSLKPTAKARLEKIQKRRFVWRRVTVFEDIGEPERTCATSSSSHLIDPYVGSQLVIVERCHAHTPDTRVMALHVVD